MRGAKSAKWVAVRGCRRPGCDRLWRRQRRGERRRQGRGRPERYFTIEVGEPRSPLQPADTDGVQRLHRHSAPVLQPGGLRRRRQARRWSTPSRSTPRTARPGPSSSSRAGSSTTAPRSPPSRTSRPGTGPPHIDNKQANAFWFSDIKGYDASTRRRGPQAHRHHVGPEGRGRLHLHHRADQRRSRTSPTSSATRSSPRCPSPSTRTPRPPVRSRSATARTSSSQLGAQEAIEVASSPTTRARTRRRTVVWSSRTTPPSRPPTRT